MNKDKTLKLTQNLLNEIDEMVYKMDNKFYHCNDDIYETFNTALIRSINQSKLYASKQQQRLIINNGVSEERVNNFVRKRK